MYLRHWNLNNGVDVKNCGSANKTNIIKSIQYIKQDKIYDGHRDVIFSEH